MAEMISGAELRARRQALGVPQRKLAVLLRVAPDAVGRIERGEPASAERVRAIADALTNLERSMEREGHFPAAGLAPVGEGRTRPWPVSAMRSLLDFHAEGVALGADVVAVAGAAPVVVIIGVSQLGAFIVSSSTGCTPPAGLVYRVDAVAGTIADALDGLAGSTQLARVLRGQGVPPMRVLQRVEPAIVAHRDANGRVTLHVLPVPVQMAPPGEVVVPAPPQKPRRRSPQARGLAVA